jgi:hypothetical protein
LGDYAFGWVVSASRSSSAPKCVFFVLMEPVATASWPACLARGAGEPFHLAAQQAVIGDHAVLAATRQRTVPEFPAHALQNQARNGADEMDKRILEMIVMKFAGGPVGLNSLAVAVGEEPDTLEEVYEPFLIMEGYLNRTSQGRVATELSYKNWA